MPIYEYECYSCKKKFEKIQKLSDKPVTVCPYCGGFVHKCFSVPALSFKGKGFYITDYAGNKKGSDASIHEGSGKGKKKAEREAASSKGGKQV